jgi:hemerythrin-like domain-containing protein
MNALSLLKADYKKVSGLFKKLEPTTERGVKTREELFATLKQELDVHTYIEETYLYPVLEKADETHDIALEAFEEHAVVKDLLAELEKLSKDDETWGAKLKVLKENVEHHVEEEEGEMFKKARKVLSEEELESLGARMERAKESQLKKAA